ncbi:hypothetical protein BRD13_05545, partial [Halobacteriales archaeon SW_5_70_135]
IAPTIYGYDQQKLAMALQLFSGVTKDLPDGSRIRGDLHMLLIGDPGTGKCQKYDTKVTLADGTEREIGALVEERLEDPESVDDGVYERVDISVQSVDGSEVTRGRATKVWKREAPPEMYRIRLRSGRELEVTPSHPLFRIESRTPVPARADELEEGEFLTVPRRLRPDHSNGLKVEFERVETANANSLTVPEEMTPSLARLLGYTVAEGHVSGGRSSGTLTITSADEAVIGDAASALDELGVRYWTQQHHSRDGVEVLHCSSSELVRFLGALEPATLETSARQRVPDQIMRSDRGVRAAFLRAYVEGEGHVSPSEREITVASMSETLLEQARSLLLSLGIDSQIHSRQNDSHRLRISGQDFERYLTQVGFITERKSVDARRHDGTPDNTNTDVVPSVGEDLGRIRERLALSQHECGLPRPTYQHYEQGDRDPSRDSLRTVLDAFERRLDELGDLRARVEECGWEAVEAAREELKLSQAALAGGMTVSQTAVSYYGRENVVSDGDEVRGARQVVLDRIDEALGVESQVRSIRRLVDGDLGWDRIESIEVVDPDYEWVYDLEVEDTHTYVSNGVVSHNSQLLQYVQEIAPRSVYTSGKGASTAGLCVTGDTLVHTEDGFRQIGDIIGSDLPDAVDTETATERSVGLYTYDESSGELDLRDSSHVWRMPEKSTRRIETTYGKGIEASRNTPLLTCGDGGLAWTPIEDVEPGDCVAVPSYEEIERSTPPVSEYLELTNERVKLADESIEFVRDRLRETHGDLRTAAAELDLPESFLYHSLLHRYVPVDRLDRVLDAVDADRSDVRIERAMLRHGDDVRIPRAFDVDLLYLLGLVFGDGDIRLSERDGNRGMVRISNGDEALLERAATIVKETFDKSVEIEYQEDRVPCIRLHSATVARLFANVGMTTPKDDLALAPRLTTAEHADAFLRGLMDADGSVSVRETDRSSVQLSTVSEELGRQVQLMLATYGVHAKRRERDRRGTYELEDGQTIENTSVRTHLEMYGGDIDTYAEAIGFESSEKQAALDRIAGEVDRKGERVPVGGAIAAADGSSSAHYSYTAWGSRPGRDGARSILDDVDLGDATETIEEAVEAHLRYEEVAAAVDTGRKELYDLTVPESHNFLGNGIVTHNTAAAVQDDFGDGQEWSLEAGALVLADRGIAAVDELDKMESSDRSAMHEALEQQSYHPDTELLLADGRRVEIGAFVDERMAERPEEIVDGVDCEILPVDGARVHSVDTETGDVQKLPVDRVSRHEAPNEFVRLTFSNGRSVTVTPEHPTFVARGDGPETVAATEVEEGTFVPAPRKLPNADAAVQLSGEPTRSREKDVRLPDELTGDLAEFLGLLVAEGHSYAGSAHEIGFSNQNERLLSRAGELARLLFGVESTDTTNDAGTVTKRWVSTRLYRWFESEFSEVMRTAREKRIPARVLGASEEHIRRFLVGAFAGDGGVESEAMAFSTASGGLANDYADALAKLGIATRIHHVESTDSWKTYVTGDSTERFVEAVVEPDDDRYEAAQSFVDRSTETPGHHDVLPTGVAEEIRSLRRLVGVPLSGKYYTHLENGYGVRTDTVRSDLATIRERVAEVRTHLPAAETLSEVRECVGWSGRQLAERLDGETTSSVHYAEADGYDGGRREKTTRRARRAVEGTLAEAEDRLGAIEEQLDLRYYRVADVERVQNDDVEWVYDVTVEPTNTFVGQGVLLHNSVSISKAGINATLKSRCSLLGAANPKYGRFDQYEPIGEQIDLEPALISRFDLIFTVTDKPDEEEDRRLAEHILNTNYAGELSTQQAEMTSPDVDPGEVEAATEEVDPVIDPGLLQKYIAYAKQNCHPRMTDAARAAIQEFYTDLRAKGTDEDAPVPVTARKLEATVRLAEASAKVRLSDEVTREDAERVIEIVRSCLKDVGVDPESGDFDADVVETGTSKTQRDRIQNIRTLISEIQDEYDVGAPIDVVTERGEDLNMDRQKIEHEIEKLKKQGELYQPDNDHVRTT